jgi:outer membrane lipoprotein-sorting protein
VCKPIYHIGLARNQRVPVYNKVMPLRRSHAVLIFCLILLTSPSCLVRRRSIARKGGKVNQALLVADKQTLMEAVQRQYDAIQDFNMEVNMIPALGSTEKNKVTEYKDVRAYILFRKPAEIRIIGLYPVVRNKAFDMVSNGTDFKLFVPSRNRFLVGSNEIVQPSANKLENLRPQHFLDAILVRPIDPAKDKVLIENFTDEDNAFYLLHVLRENGNGQLQLARTIWFSRIDLKLARQLIFDAAGNILTDARYSDWKTFDNVAFPKHIEINRPRDEYAVVLDIVKMDINKGISPSKFVLEQPEGSIVQVVGQAPATLPVPPAKGKTKKK